MEEQGRSYDGGIMKTKQELLDLFDIIKNKQFLVEYKKDNGSKYVNFAPIKVDVKDLFDMLKLYVNNELK